MAIPWKRSVRRRRRNCPSRRHRARRAKNASSEVRRIDDVFLSVSRWLSPSPPPNEKIVFSSLGLDQSDKKRRSIEHEWPSFRRAFLFDRLASFYPGWTVRVNPIFNRQKFQYSPRLLLLLLFFLAVHIPLFKYLFWPGQSTCVVVCFVFFFSLCMFCEKMIELRICLSRRCICFSLSPLLCALFGCLSCDDELFFGFVWKKTKREQKRHRASLDV